MQKFVLRTVFDAHIVEYYDNYISLEISGKNAEKIFKFEQGKHQWHEVSGDKVHTSNISVAVLPLLQLNEFKINENDLEIKTTRGSGKGGQHRNKVETCVVIKHLPTGTTVRAETERSQLSNKETALKILYSKLKAIHNNKQKTLIETERSIQHGSGKRADKDRVYIEKRNEVVDYKNNLRFSLDCWLKGKWT